MTSLLMLIYTLLTSQFKLYLVVKQHNEDMLCFLPCE